MALLLAPLASVYHSLVAAGSYIQVGSAFSTATAQAAVVTITDPGTASPFSKATDIYIYAIAADYNSAASGNLTIVQGSLPTALTYNVTGGAQLPTQLSPFNWKFPAGSGNVVITLPSGGANTTNGLVVYFGFSTQ